MIPIFSSIVVACTSNYLWACGSSFAHNPSSSIVTENRVSADNHNISYTLAQSTTQLDNPIAIEVEMPPVISAESLGEPIKTNSGLIPTNVSTQNLSENRLLITRSRQGNSRYFEFDPHSLQFQLVQSSTQSNSPPASLNVVEVLADQQEYLEGEQIIKAKGNVVIRFSNGILVADQVLLNLVDRVAVAQDNVNLQRGEQILRGDRFEYYFVEDKGVIYNAQGEIYQPSLNQDVDVNNANTPIQRQPLSSQFEFNQPLRRVSSQEGYSFVVGSVRDLAILQQSGGAGVSTQGGGQINRFRFQAEKVNFDSESWQAINIRITNDPFSPPEFEIRADTANLVRISDYQDELITTNSRLVFDQRFSVPLFRNRLVFNRRDRNPGLFTIGFDGEDLGGLYIEREFDLYSDERVLFTITPQILLQRAFFPDAFFDENTSDDDDNGGLFNPSSYGLVTKLEVGFSERTSFRAIANLTGLDLDNIDNRLRSTVRLNQKIGDLNRPYNLSLQYNFRDRLFNGSLGFRTVQQSFGALITSPYIPLGTSPFTLQYQASLQNIRAESDRQELIGENSGNELVNLTRFQGAALLNGNFLLWSGEPLPATAEEGLKYTSTPVAPYLSLNTGLTGVASYYSNGDNQPNLTATIGLQGQLGNFSRPFLDYTGFNISFSQGIRGEQSPFLFDRAADSQVLSLGLTQQLYGPLRGGLQTFYNIDTNEEISTDYFLEYSRRTYNVILRYNPVLEIGSINLRISDFNWEGNSAPFEGGTGVKPVVDGVTIDN